VIHCISKRETIFKKKGKQSLSETQKATTEYLRFNTLVKLSPILKSQPVVPTKSKHGVLPAVEQTQHLKALTQSHLFFLNKGERIKILVGEKGYDGYSTYCGGGGGGSFVAKGETPLCVAGGGGGNEANTIPSTSYACGQSGQYGGDPQSRRVSLTYGGLASYYCGGGGGFRYNGNDPNSDGKGGISFLNGGWRQTTSPYSGKGYGGFGGGGSTHSNCGGSGGGGGYTGGSGYAGNQGGGGGSFFTGTYGEANSMAISGCDSFPTKPTSDLNGNVVLTIMMDVIPNVNKCITYSCHSFQISLCVLFSTLISF
jgi:hypothetical protein